MPDPIPTPPNPWFNPKIVDTVTNVLGFLLFAIEPVRAYMTTTPFNWGTFAACLFTAGIAYFTGKSSQFK